MGEPGQAEKPKADKVVPEAHFIAFKKGSEARERKLKEELAEVKGQVTQMESELKIAKLNAEDDAEISKVKGYLVDEAKKVEKALAEVNEKRAKIDEDLASLTEREKEARVKALASEHKVEIDAIKDAEDPEKEALRLVAQRLTKELENKVPGSEIFESGTPGSVKTKVKDMKDEEFDKVWEQKKQEALSKR